MFGASQNSLLVRGRGVSAYYARRDPLSTNELAGLEALATAGHCIIVKRRCRLSIATCFECILFMTLPIVSLDPLGL